MLFGVFYFVQGIAEPTAGLVSQPVLALLKSWQLDAGQIGQFKLLLGMPWYCKPLYGLLTDFVPLAGYHRKTYLTLASLVTASGMIALVLLPLPYGAVTLVLGLLLLPSVGLAFSDVVIDALMVDKGQPLGLTGRIQSIQWGTIWGATILTGFAGGLLAESKSYKLGFLICGLMALVTLYQARFKISESRVPPGSVSFKRAGSTLLAAVSSPAILPIAMFLFLWNFNPFASEVLYIYMTRDLEIGEGFFGWSAERFYGLTQSVNGVAAMLASLGYGLYCRRVSRRWLVHLSIVGGILSTIGYWAMSGEVSALVISFAVGATYATAQMVQLDLAAQSCPPLVAGTAFALLMSLSNFGTQLSTSIGGRWYESLRTAQGSLTAFQILVGIGAAFTACCWLLVPLLRKSLPRIPQESDAGFTDGD